MKFFPGSQWLTAGGLAPLPITEELDNIKTLVAVGFDYKQEEAIAGIIEKPHVDGLENIKEFRTTGKSYSSQCHQ